jgi:F0F1-type ATP synthase epsilon subunit
MLCKLGLGIMKVMPISEDQTRPESDILLLIDGGFALISSNIVTVISYDALWFRETRAERIEQMLQKAKKKLGLPGISPQQREHDAKKLALMTQLAQMYKLPATEPARSEPQIPEEILNS